MTTSEKFSKKCLNILEDKKAVDGLIMELKGQSVIADYFVIVSGNTERHVKAMAEDLNIEMKKQDKKVYRVNGLDFGTWVVMDYGDVIIHIFKKDVRAFYDLERLWRENLIIEDHRKIKSV